MAQQGNTNCRRARASVQMVTTNEYRCDIDRKEILHMVFFFLFFSSLDFMCVSHSLFFPGFFPGICLFGGLNQVCMCFCLIDVRRQKIFWSLLWTGRTETDVDLCWSLLDAYCWFCLCMPKYFKDRQPLKCIECIIYLIYEPCSSLVLKCT